MENKFKGKYRKESFRLRNWDYGSNAYYYVTINTKDRICYFGEIENREMKLSDIGILANSLWLEIPQRFNYAILDEFVIMPNHMHGIIRIQKYPPAPSSHPPPTNTLCTEVINHVEIQS